MDEILTTTLILTGLCLLFGVILAVSFKKLRVFEDPRIDKVENLLPGANCGACGMPGCRAFSEKVVDGSMNPGKCTVSPENKIEEIAGLLGIEASQETKKVARLLCAGGKDESHNLISYKSGISTCRGENVVSGGHKDCSWGCIGLGDCKDVCDFDAIFMNEDGLPQVIPNKCTACGDCVEICPKDLFVLMPIDQKLIVQCKSELEGDAVLEKCSVGCTACERCVADAHPNLIKMAKNLPLIDYDLNNLASPEAVGRCPTGAIAWLSNDSQFSSEAGNKNLPLGRVESLNELEDYIQ